MTDEPRILRQCSAKVEVNFAVENHCVVLFDNGVLAHHVKSANRAGWRVIRSPQGVTKSPIADLSLSAHSGKVESLTLTALFLDGTLAEIQIDSMAGGKWSVIAPLDWEQIPGPWLEMLGYEF